MMRRICFYIFIRIISGSIQSAFGQEKEHRPVIVIDPGHGGTDSGAIGITGLKEKDMVFEIAAEVLRLNRKVFDDRMEIYSTRYSDALVSLGDRSKLAKALKPNVFVSIHCNRAIRNEAQGIEVYVKRSNGKAERLARLFIVGLSKKLGFKNRGSNTETFRCSVKPRMVPVFCWNWVFCRIRKKRRISPSRKVLRATHY